MIRVFALEVLVPKREQQRIDEWNPSEAWSREPTPHSHAVCQHDVDTQLIQHPSRIGIALFSDYLFFVFDQFFNVLFAHVIVPIVVEEPPRFHVFGVLGAQTNGQWSGFHFINQENVEVLVRRLVANGSTNNVRMIVNNSDLADFVQKRLGFSLMSPATADENAKENASDGPTFHMARYQRIVQELVRLTEPPLGLRTRVVR